MLKKSLMPFFSVLIFMSFFLTYAKHMEYFAIIIFSLILYLKLALLLQFILKKKLALLMVFLFVFLILVSRNLGVVSKI